MKKIRNMLFFALLVSVFVISISGFSVAKESITLTLITQVPPEINLQDNPILKKAEELTGIKLDIEAPPLNNYSERCQIMMASGDMPDFFLGGTDRDFENWSRQGLLATLDDKVSQKKYPNLMKNATKERWSDTTSASTGKIQAVPRPNDPSMWGYLINNEWLKKVNMKAPATIDEFVKVCRAFANNDPDGNGKKDTYGFTTEDDIWYLHTEFIKTCWNLSIHNGVADIDGVYRPRYMMKGLLDYMTFLRTMYGEGLLDPEFFTNKGAMYQEKFLQGRVGIIGADKNDGIKFVMEKKVPLNKYSYYGPLALKKGAKGKFIVPPSNWCAFLIPANTKKMDYVLKFLDFANSEEGFKLFQIGIKGIHYNSYDIKKRQIIRTPEQTRLLQTHTNAMMSFANGYLDRSALEGGDTAETRQKYQTEWANAEKGAVKVYVPFVKMYDAFFATLPDLFEKTKEMDIKYITGGITKEQYIDFIEKEYTPKVSKFAAQYNDYMNSLK